MIQLLKIALFLVLINACHRHNDGPCSLNPRDQELNANIEELIRSEQFTLAKSLLRERINNGPPKHLFMQNMGATLYKIYFNQDDHKIEDKSEILRFFERADSLCPGRETTLGSIVETLYAFHQYDEAISAAHKYLTLFEPNSAAYSRISDCYRELNNYQESLIYADHGIAADTTCHF